MRRLLCRRAGQTSVGMKCTHFVFQCFEPLFSQSLPEPLSAPLPLIQCMLRHRVSSEGAVPLRHAQGGSSMAGHTDEALAAWEAEHRHLVKAHVALCTSKLGPLQDRANWLGWKKSRRKHQKKCFQFSLVSVSFQSGFALFS